MINSKTGVSSQKWLCFWLLFSANPFGPLKKLPLFTTSGGRGAFFVKFANENQSNLRETLKPAARGFRA